MEKPQRLSAKELKPLIKGSLGQEIIFLDSVDSTNDYAMRLAIEGFSPHGTVVIARSQTKGKGRLGRTWASPAGNIYMSVILRPDILPKDAPLLTLLASVSCASALKELTGLTVGIKWPNDLMAEGKKLGGILTETRTEAIKLLFAVIGIGINVSAVPDDIREFATSILEEGGKQCERIPLIAEILNEMDKELNILKMEGRSEILRKWRLLSTTLHREVVVTTAGGTIEGTASDIDEEGRLILRAKDGSIKKISSGDLRMRGQCPP